MKKKFIIAAAIAFILFAGMLLYKPTKPVSDIHHGNPTLFVHGYKGTSNSFGHMLHRFEDEYGWGKKGLVYYVTSNGRVRDYHLSKGREEPMFVQVIFQDNRASFEDTTRWLASVTTHLKENYHANEINLVGHSMGGIVSLKFLQDYEGEEYPDVDRFIAIGSPFDGIYSQKYFQIHHDEAATDLKPGSLALELIQKNGFPPGTEVLNVASTGDSVARPESVQSIRTVIPGNKYNETMIVDEELGHSALHENEQVDWMIHSFLWKERED
ncbi:alpha/beta hydrolase [Virgibacillus xinjiangensis]|uniref:Alpha/beta hydrolase n=1 Tax=Virgibacillus xinjiangensis TaxID=393090 RepID=A0ABV7CV17_9BACI